MPDEARETAGARLLLIRAARGGGAYPESQPDFIAEYNRRYGTDYDATWLSRRETGRTPITVEEAVQFAAMDPQQRGAPWLAFGPPDPPKGSDGPLPAELLRPANGTKRQPRHA